MTVEAVPLRPPSTFTPLRDMTSVRAEGECARVPAWLRSADLDSALVSLENIAKRMLLLGRHGLLANRDVPGHLWEAATNAGLVEAHGADAVQAVLADAARHASQDNGRERQAVRAATLRPVPSLSNDIVTEDSAALRFVELHGGDLRFCHPNIGWYVWHQGIWSKDRTGSVFQFARELGRQLSEDQDERKRYITNKTAFAAAVERFAKVDPRVAVTMEQWDREPMLIGTPGGTVDLLAGTLRPGRREDFITKKTSVAPSAAGCPRWRNFLGETTGQDQEVIRFLQQWCGYALTGSTREHALVFVYGPGGNGKSVFLSVVTRILGEYAATAAMGTFTASKMDRHPTEIAMLHGARLVTASETEEGQAWAESRIKEMTGGDQLTARFMKQDFFTFIPQFKLMIVGNYTPVLQNVDDAMLRRFLIVPFERRPAEPDRELEQKLMSEASGILQWMIDGCLDWQRHGLVKPASVLAATEEYFTDQDLFGHWLAEHCDVDPQVFDSSSSLFKSWKEYALSCGGSPGTTKSFKTKLVRQGCRYVKTRRTRDFHGVKLRPSSLSRAAGD